MERKRTESWPAFFLGLLLGPIGILIVAVANQEKVRSAIEGAIICGMITIAILIGTITYEPDRGEWSWNNPQGRPTSGQIERIEIIGGSGGQCEYWRNVNGQPGTLIINTAPNGLASDCP